MNNDEKSYVAATIDEEGFDYTFMSYSDFSDIEDDEFHKLRRMYLNVVDAMNKLLTINGEDLI